MDAAFFENLAKIIVSAAQSNRGIIALTILVGGWIVVKIFAPRDKPGAKILALLIVTVTAVSLFIVAIVLEKNKTDSEREVEVIKMAETIRQDINALNLADAAKVLESLLKLSLSSGHALYFQGEMQRVMRPNRNLFAAVDWFVKYLDDPRSVATLGSDRLDARSCYENAEGFCRQRAGWVAHLLANIFYRVSTEQDRTASQRREYLERAQKYAQLSLRYYPLKFPSTFQESGNVVDNKWSTDELIKLIDDGLAEQ